MNIFWNVVDPIDVSDTKRLMGEVEIAALNTAFEVAVRYLFGLKPEFVNTFLANKLSMHFDGGMRGLIGSKAKAIEVLEFTDAAKDAFTALLTEGLEARGIIQTYYQGLHVPIYSWKTYASIVIGRFLSRIAFGMVNKSLPATLLAHVTEANAHVAIQQKIGKMKSESG